MQLPDGLSIIYDVITEEEEQQLLNEIDNTPWDNTLSRRTQHYITRYNYKKGMANEPGLQLTPLIESFAQKLVLDNICKTMPDQIIVNEYKRTQGISAHTDSRIFDDTIISLSLGCETIMVFRHKSKCPNGIPLLLPPRSMIVMSKEARYLYTHEIPSKTTYIVNNQTKIKPIDYRRVSITFRNIKK
jgi:alkylated DNA repair dioxygenase AlkB